MPLNYPLTIIIVPTKIGIITGRGPIANFYEKFYGAI